MAKSRNRGHPSAFSFSLGVDCDVSSRLKVYYGTNALTVCLRVARGVVVIVFQLPKVVSVYDCGVELGGDHTADDETILTFPHVLERYGIIEAIRKLSSIL